MITVGTSFMYNKYASGKSKEEMTNRFLIKIILLYIFLNINSTIC